MAADAAIHQQELSVLCLKSPEREAGATTPPPPHTPPTGVMSQDGRRGRAGGKRGADSRCLMRLSARQLAIRAEFPQIQFCSGGRKSAVESDSSCKQSHLLRAWALFAAVSPNAKL